MSHRRIYRIVICFGGSARCRKREIGAKNGTRTRDPNLGKVVLYQLSYFRIYALQHRGAVDAVVA